MPNEYTLVSGETVTYDDPDPEVADYVARVREAAQDPTVSVDDLLELIYSNDNPLLESDQIPGKGMVTTEVFEDPVYKVMADQISVKRIQQGTLDPETMHDKYTVSVSDAADELGISTSAVRQAIYKDRLAAVKKGGAWKIAPSSIDAYEVSNRGPSAATGEPLHVVIGSKKGVSFSVAHDGELERERQEGNLIYGTIRNWTHAAIKSVRKFGRNGDAIDAVELRPDSGLEASDSISTEDLKVQGMFSVESVALDNRQANLMFKELRERIEEE